MTSARDVLPNIGSKFVAYADDMSVMVTGKFQQDVGIRSSFCKISRPERILFSRREIKTQLSLQMLKDSL